MGGRGRPDLCEFQADQGYIVRPYLNKTKAMSTVLEPRKLGQEKARDFSGPVGELQIQ